MPGMTNRGFASPSGFGSFNSPGQAFANTGSPFHNPRAVQGDQSGTNNSATNGAGHQHGHSLDVISGDMWERYERIKSNHSDTQAFITELITHNNAVTHEYYKAKDDLQRERASKRSIFAPQITHSFRPEYEKLKSDVERDPFVLVLIDGDAMVFHEAYLQDGEAGGREAASELLSSVQAYISERQPEVPPAFKVIVRMYANVKGLSENCYRAGLTNSPSVIENFFRGFTNAEPLFDFVDIGIDRGQMFEKTSELFKLHSYDLRCKHIILGCSYSNGFAGLLENYMYDTTIKSRVTLLEGIPFEDKLKNLPYKCQRFGNIFRVAEVTPSSSTTSIKQAMRHGVSRTPSESLSLVSSNENVYAKSANISTWASRAAAAAAVVAAVPSPPKTPAEPVTIPHELTKTTIPRNIKGQRIDAPFRYDRAEVERVRKSKMCNVHYLRKECPYGDNCTHRHDLKVSLRDLENLKIVAQAACCRNGSLCDDTRCIYGHRCQAPERRDKYAFKDDGGKTCIFGPDCVFPKELHGIDLNVVRTTKV